MASVNKVILIGNLGKDPQVDHTTAGMARCRFSLATSEQYKDKDGQRAEKVEWHNILFWGRQAEIAGEYLKKGSQLYVEGRIASRQYQDQEGQTKYITEIVGREMQFLGNAKQDEPAPSSAPKPRPQAAPPPDDEDDLPF